MANTSSSFYLTLPSNASMTYFPNNEPSDFTVKLDPPLDLEGSYEIGLTEIAYPRNWYNLGDVTLRIFQLNKDNRRINKKIITIPRGHFQSVPQLIDELNDHIPEEYTTGSPRLHRFPKTFTYIPSTGHVVLGLLPQVGLVLEKPLSEMLGFPTTYFRGGLDLTSRKPARIPPGFSCMYIYLDAVRDQVVGDVRAPLLRLAPIEGVRGDIVFHSFQNIQYVPLRFHSFDKLTVNIRNGLGELIPFRAGEVILTVHLRKIGFPST